MAVNIDVGAEIDSIRLTEQESTPAPDGGYSHIFAKADGLYIVDDDDVVTGPLATGVDGWISANETWVYASADDPTFTFTIAGVDLTTKYSAGMRIKLTQTSVKYFIITKVAFSTNTTITVYGGTDYDLANATITSPYYSMVKAPFGFPLDPIKWTVIVTDTNMNTQSNPTQNVWYNLGSISISIPVGIWTTSYQIAFQVADGVAGILPVHVTLSTANNSESDPDFTCNLLGKNIEGVTSTFYREKSLVIASKTVYYQNERTTLAGIDTIQTRGDMSKQIIRAVCAYL